MNGLNPCTRTYKPIEQAEVDNINKSSDKRSKIMNIKKEEKINMKPKQEKNNSDKTNFTGESMNEGRIFQKQEIRQKASKSKIRNAKI